MKTLLLLKCCEMDVFDFVATNSFVCGAQRRRQDRSFGQADNYNQTDKAAKYVYCVPIGTSPTMATLKAQEQVKR